MSDLKKLTSPYVRRDAQRFFKALLGLIIHELSRQGVFSMGITEVLVPLKATDTTTTVNNTDLQCFSCGTNHLVAYNDPTCPFTTVIMYDIRLATCKLRCCFRCLREVKAIVIPDAQKELLAKIGEELRDAKGFLLNYVESQYQKPELVVWSTSKITTVLKRLGG